VAVATLQAEHHFGQTRRSDRSPNAFLADREVLTKQASHRAVGEEDGSRTACPADRRLFAVVAIVAGDRRLGRSAAKPLLSSQPIDAARARTEVTLGDAPSRFFGSTRQLAALEKREKRRPQRLPVLMRPSAGVRCTLHGEKR